MSDKLEHETIERAFKGVAEVAGKLPDNVEGREVQRLTKIAEDLAHHSMERRADR